MFNRLQDDEQEAGRLDPVAPPACARVLIAEDDPIMRSALAELVESRAGLEVAGTAGDAFQAAELAERLLPNVAVVDVRMPGGGLQAVRWIRQRSPATRVVAFSAYADRASVREMLLAGAAEYVVKGVDPKALVEAMESSGRGRVGLPAGEINELIADLVSLLHDRDDEHSDAPEHLRRAVGEAGTRLRTVLTLADAALQALRRTYPELGAEFDRLLAAAAAAEAVAGDLEALAGESLIPMSDGGDLAMLTGAA